MVNPSHLRINNWIHRKGSSAYGIVNGKLLALLEEDEKERERFEYIELTRELLEAAGFKYNKIEGVARLSEDFEDNEGDTEYWTHGKLTIVSWNKGPLTLSNKASFDHRVELTHLHQLQNGYLFLTGTELPLPESAKIINQAVEK